MMMDAGEGYPNTEASTHVLTSTFSAVYHVFLLVLLFFAIYGLSGIYHTAEELLEHKGIVKKFLVYKIFTLLAKFQGVIFITLVHHNVINKFEFNETWPVGIRVNNCLAFAICVEAMISFPLALKFYSTDDYVAIDTPGNGLQEEEKDTRHGMIANVQAGKQPEDIETNEV